MIQTAFPRDVKLSLLASDLAKVPWKSYQVAPYSIGTNGGSNSAATVQAGGISNNNDGSSIAVYLKAIAMPPDYSGSVARCVFPFRGRVLGLRFIGPLTFKFGVAIDGEGFEIDPTNAFLSNGGVWSGSHNEECAVIVCDDLEDGLHVCEVVVPCDAVGGSDRTLTLLGPLLEKRLGYRHTVPEIHNLIQEKTLDTPQRAFLYQLGGPVPRGITRVLYTNTSASPVMVTVMWNGVQKYQFALAAKDAAGSSDTLDFGENGVAPVVYWTHGASVAGVVNATVLGKWG